MMAGDDIGDEGEEAVRVLLERFAGLPDQFELAFGLLCAFGARHRLEPAETSPFRPWLLRIVTGKMAGEIVDTDCVIDAAQDQGLFSPDDPAFGEGVRLFQNHLGSLLILCRHAVTDRPKPPPRKARPIAGKIDIKAFMERTYREFPNTMRKLAEDD